MKAKSKQKPKLVCVMRGHRVYSEPPEGTIAVAGPFRPMTEDWMLFNAIQDMVRGNIGFVLVQERASTARGGFVGVSVWRNGSQRA